MKKPILPTEILIALHPSLYLWGWLGFFSMLVVGVLAYCLPWPIAFAAILLYAIYLLWQYTQLVATRHEHSIRTLRVDVYGQLSVVDGLGRRWFAEVLPDTVVHRYGLLIHLHYLDEATADEQGVKESADRKTNSLMSRWLRPTRLLILPDHADAESLRALRVWLRWGLHY
ncbi:protein YgfX [Methylophilus aquaticus]|uniref:Uncharacterized protein n=1 Tax=Methylophilus aquaticus TaxID=1971610 RepID=A0ABT9JUX9_9PROT|nr:protein YgfX [Methylophilus aquaticus]MDP8568408.1 hypothetical protein [Methylophilus aquaticus]